MTDQVQTADAFGTPATETPEQTTQQPVAQQPSTPTLAIPTEAQELIGEGKKYASPEVALAALPHAQRHISQIEAENERLRADLERAARLEEAVSRIEQGQSQTATPATPAYDPNRVREDMKNVVTEMREDERRAANVESANNKMFELYGEKSPEVTAKVAQQLGVSISFLKATAEASPDAFLKLVSDNDNSGTGMPQHEEPSINSEALGHQHTGGDEPSAKVGSNPSTKDLVKGWNASKERVAKRLQTQ